MVNIQNSKTNARWSTDTVVVCAQSNLRKHWPYVLIFEEWPDVKLGFTFYTILGVIVCGLEKLRDRRKIKEFNYNISISTYHSDFSYK